MGRGRKKDHSEFCVGHAGREKPMKHPSGDVEQSRTQQGGWLMYKSPDGIESYGKG